MFMARYYSSTLKTLKKKNMLNLILLWKALKLMEKLINDNELFYPKRKI